jgi:hypothetical protein
MWDRKDILFIITLVVVIISLSVLLGEYYPDGFYLLGILSIVAVPLYYTLKKKR